MKTANEGIIEVGLDIYRWRFNGEKGYFSLSGIDDSRLFVTKVLSKTLNRSDIIELVKTGLTGF